MAILQITTDFAGQTGVQPRLVRIVTNDIFATITASNYLQAAKNQGFAFYPTDMCAVAYGTSSNIVEWFTLTITSSSITLAPTAGNITQPVTIGDFAVFGANGSLKDLGYLPSNAAKTTVPMMNGAVTSGNIAQYFDTAGTLTNGSVAANKILTSTIVAPDVSSNLITFNVTATFAQLASAGTVPVIPSTGSKQYRIWDIFLNSNGTNFSGGTGDRLGQFTDNTTQYGVIPAATLQTLVNARWGDANLSYPTSASINTPTVAGSSLYLKYSGGTHDYTAGSITVSVLAERIA